MTRYLSLAAWLSVWLGLNLLRLLLVDAGPALHFEHVRAAAALFHGGVPRFDLLALGGLCFVGLSHAMRLRREIFRALSVTYVQLGPWRSLVALGVLVATAAFPSREFPVFGVEIVLSLVLRAALASLFCALLLEIPLPTRAAVGTRIGTWLDAADGSSVFSRWPLRFAALSFVVSALLAFFSYERVPHIPDEVAYLFQARYFATFALWAPEPPVKEAFETYLVTCQHGHCFSPFPPGWPAVLALGVLAGAPWLVNPLLGACNVLLVFVLARQLFDLRVARLSALLFALSPWHLLMSMSFMSHTFALFCALVAAYCVVRTRETGKALYCVLGGACIGLVSLSRPLEAAVVAGVLGLAALAPYQKKLRVLPVILLGASTALVAALNFPYNLAISGNARVFPVSKYMDDYWGAGRNDMGFGASRSITWNGLDPFPGHGLRDVIVNSQLCTTLIHNELFGWGFGSLWLAVALLLLGWARRNDFWLCSWIVLVVVTQAFYWFSGGPDFGARYWYTAIVPLVLLSARALLLLDETFARVEWPRAFTSSALLLSLTALLVFVPWRAVDKYRHYRQLQPGMHALLAEHDLGRALVFVRGKNHPDYVSALNETPIDPQANAPVVFWAKDADTVARLTQAYPDRKVVFVDGPSLAGGKYQLSQ